MNDDAQKLRDAIRKFLADNDVDQLRSALRESDKRAHNNDDKDQSTFFGTFDAKESAARRDEAENRVESHANEEWQAAAYESVRTVALSQEFFNSDDVQADLQEKPVETHDLRALGPVMMRALREGLIIQSGDFTRTTQVKSHRSPCRIWRSLIYRP